MDDRTARHRGGSVHARAADRLDALRRQTHASDAIVFACLDALNRGTLAGRDRGAGGQAARGGAAGSDIAFAATSHALAAAARSALDRWSTRLARDPGLRVLIGGFPTSANYSSAFMGLTLRRVEVIRRHLRSRGLPPARIDVAVCGSGWFVVERSGRGTDGDASGRALLQIVDVEGSTSRN